MDKSFNTHKICKALYGLALLITGILSACSQAPGLVVQGTRVPPVPKFPQIEASVDGNLVIVGVPALQAWPDVLVGGQVTPKVLVVKNLGASDLSLGSIDVPPGFEMVGEVPQVIVAGSSISLSLSPLTSSVGTSGGPVVIHSNDPTTPELSFIISCHILALPVPAPHIVVTLDQNLVVNNSNVAVDLGSQKRGSDPIFHDLRISNDGDAPLSVSDITIPDGFKLQDPFVAFVLNPGESMDLHLGISTLMPAGDYPAVAATGAKVIISNNDPKNSPFTFKVKATILEKDPVDYSMVATVPVSSNKIDILFVVDASGSMVEEQQTLKDSFAGFISKFTENQLDYHIGVIAPDTRTKQSATNAYYRDTRHLVPATSNWAPGMLLAKSDTNRFLSAAMNVDLVIQGFKDNSDVGTVGSGNETGVRSIVAALSPTLIGAGGANADFLRSDARLSIVVVSDEDDTYYDEKQYDATGKELPGSAGYTRTFPDGRSTRSQQLNQALLAAKTDLGLVRMDAVVADKDGNLVYNIPGDTTSGRLQVNGADACALVSSRGPDGVNYLGTGDFYKELTNIYHGQTIDICKGNFANDLAKLGSDIASSFQNAFTLQHVPFDVSQIKVTVNGILRAQSSTDGWTYDPVKNQITLHGMGLAAMTSYTVRIDFNYIPQ